MRQTRSAYGKTTSENKFAHWQFGGGTRNYKAGIKHWLEGISPVQTLFDATLRRTYISQDSTGVGHGD